MLAAHPQLARVVDPFETSEWETAVAARPEASFFHGAIWARILSDTYGFTPYYLKADETCMLPIMEVNSFISGRRGVALPFTDECEPLVGAPGGLDLLLRPALDRLAARKWRYFELRGGSSGLPNTPTAATFFGHEITLEGKTPNLVTAGCSNSARGAVKKAEKSGVIVEISRRFEDMESFYGLLCQTRKRHGNPPQPFKFFCNIHRHAIERGAGMLLLARHAGVAIAGAVFLHAGRSAIYKYAASDIAFRHLAANNLVLSRALEWYSQNGFRRLQLGRTSLGNEGLRRFKLGWGSREYSIKYFRYSTKARAFVPGTDKSSGWQSRIFQLLPQRVSRHLGALAYRHIA